MVVLPSTCTLRVGAALVATVLIAQPALAAPTGAEITGHEVRVDADGVVNVVHFDPGGQARIESPTGRVVRGTWTVETNSLCLNANGARECWPYTAPFVAGQPMTLTSSCAATSEWTALSTEPEALPPPPPAAAPANTGERG